MQKESKVDVSENINENSARMVKEDISMDTEEILSNPCEERSENGDEENINMEFENDAFGTKEISSGCASPISPNMKLNNMMPRFDGNQESA